MYTNLQTVVTQIKKPPISLPVPRTTSRSIRSGQAVSGLARMVNATVQNLVASLWQSFFSMVLAALTFMTFPLSTVSTCLSIFLPTVVLANAALLRALSFLPVPRNCKQSQANAGALALLLALQSTAAQVLITHRPNAKLPSLLMVSRKPARMLTAMPTMMPQAPLDAAQTNTLSLSVHRIASETVIIVSM